MRFRADVALRVGAGLLIGVSLLIISFHDTPWSDLLNAIRQARPAPLCIAAIASLGVALVKAVKWRVILRPVAKVRVRSTLSAALMGGAVGCALPFRAEDAVRSYALSRLEGVSWAAVAGTVVFERAVDFVMLCVAALAALATLALPTRVRTIFYTAFVACGFVALGVVVLGRWRRRIALATGAAVAPLGRRLSNRLRRLVERVGEGAAAGARWPTLWRAFALVFVEWIVACVSIFFSLRAFNITVGPSGLLSMVLVEYMSFAASISPGSVGVYELVAKAVLCHMLHLPAQDALAAAMGHHFVMLSPFLGPGFVLVAWHGRRIPEGWFRAALSQQRSKQVVDDTSF